MWLEHSECPQVVKILVPQVNSCQSAFTSEEDCNNQVEKMTHSACQSASFLSQVGACLIGLGDT